MDSSIWLPAYLVFCTLSVSLQHTVADTIPTFLREPRSKIVRHNIRVKLRCKVDPKDALVWWSLNGQDILDPASHGMEVTRIYLIIHSFQGKGERSHNGDYQCKAGNGTGTVVSRVAHVQAAYLKRFPTHLAETTTAMMGGLSVLPCQVPDSVPPAIMAYQFKGQPISGSSDHYRVMPSGHLHILNVSSADEGHYTCSATNPLLDKTHYSGNGTTLVVNQVDDVQTLPTIKVAKGAMVNTSEKAVLECVPSGVPLPSVQWERVDGPMPSNLLQYPGSLVLYPVSMEDAGVYQCTAVNRLGQSEPALIELKVKDSEPVAIAKAPKTAYINLGGTAHFKCSVRGVAQSQIVWLFNGQRVSEMSPRHDVQDGELTIYRIVRSDLGPYQCFVQSQQGSEQATAKLALRDGFPNIIEPPLNTTAIEGENVLLTCGITGDPMPFVSWLDPTGTVVRNTRTMAISEETGGLTIYRVGPDDVGLYRCTASNKHGSEAAEAYLAVIEKISTTPVPETSSRHVLNPPKNFNDGITITTQTTDEPSKPGTVPDAPSKPIIIMKTSDTSVETRWEYFSRIPVTSFTIQYRDVSSIDGWVTAFSLIPPTRRVYEVQGLKEGATYRFRVIASNVHGDSDPSEMSNRFLMHIPESSDDSLLPAVTAPQDPPRIITCKALSSTSILVEWEFVPEFPDIAVTGFYVHYRNTDSDDDNDYIRTPVVGDDVRSYQIRNLEPELTYDIKMQTFNDGGESAFSNVVIRGTMAQETPLPPLVIPDTHPSSSPSDRNPNIPNLPDDTEPDTSSAQDKDILYITLGVVVGLILLMLIMFGVMCIWRAKQVNNDRIARDWHYGHYCDGNYRHANGNAYKFGPYMNGNTPQGHGSATPFGETPLPSDPRPLYTMPQDTLDEPTFFSGLSPPTSPVANGHAPAAHGNLHPAPPGHPPPSHNTNSNHSSASSEHLHTNGSCRSLRAGSDREGGTAPPMGVGGGGASSYSTGDRPVCPSRHLKGDRSRRRKTDAAAASREATDSDVVSDAPSSSKISFPPIIAPTAPSLGSNSSSLQRLPAVELLAKPSKGSHDSLHQSPEGSLRRGVKHSDI